MSGFSYNEFAGRGPLLPVTIDDERDPGDRVPRLAVPRAGRGRAAPVAAQEAVHHDCIADVLESTALRGTYEVRDEFDLSSAETVARGRPWYVTTD
jgi:hypothetical protein